MGRQRLEGADQHGRAETLAALGAAADRASRGGRKPHEKAALATALCRAAHRLSLVGLGQRHPDASEEELELRAACLRIGREAVEQTLGRPLPFEG